MGNSNVKLSDDQVKRCVELSKTQNQLPLDKIKQLAALFSKQTKNQEITNIDDFYELLSKAHFFDNVKGDYLRAFEGKLSKKLSEEIVQKIFTKEFQMELAQYQFKLFDRDHSGTISSNEFLSGFVICQVKDQTPEKTALIFDLWDSDLSGTLTRQEVDQGWIQSFEYGMCIAKSTMASVFSASIFSSILGSSTVDFLQSDELKKLRKMISVLLPAMTKILNENLDAQVAHVKKEIKQITDKIFEYVDENKDNTITRSEFIKGYNNPEMQTSLRELVTKIGESELSSLDTKFEVAFEEVQKANPDLFN